MAGREKTIYICSRCGHESLKWAGKCPSCGEWNTFVEETVRKETSATSFSGSNYRREGNHPEPRRLSEITAGEEQRIPLPDEELNRVLGGGLVKGSLVLLAGEPGIGKSTLVLQNMLRIGTEKVLYISAEESATQIRLRANRISHPQESDLFIACENSLQVISDFIIRTAPDIVVIDSIQTIASELVQTSAGSMVQVRECTAALMILARQTATPIILIGHINKEGSIAGPKLLEHMVDTVLHFEGDRQHLFRMLRAVKNRFGSTDETGIYEMRQDGLREVTNPSELFLSHHGRELSGVAVACAVEGFRPFLIEVQALTSTAAYGMPQRSATGFDLRRMSMLLAVLEKRVGFRLDRKDVFLNIAGGLKVNDPAIDLSIVGAILSSHTDTAIQAGVCMTGEVGLSGELRPVNRIEQRIAEAAKLGFESMLLPAHNLQGLDRKKFKIELIGVSTVEEAFRALFG